MRGNKVLDFKIKILPALIGIIFIILVTDLKAQEKPKERITFKDKVEQLEAENIRASVTEYENTSDIWKAIAEQLIQNIKDPTINQNESEISIEDWRFHVARDFQLLKRVSRIRAKTIQELRENGQFHFSEKTFERVLLEIKLIPYKLRAYLYEKSYWLKETLGRGFWGIFDIIWEVLLLLLIFTIPYLFVRVVKKIDRLIDKQRKKSFYLSFRSNFHRKIIPVLSVLSSYLLWTSILLALNIVEFLIDASAFSEFSFILPYLFYYVYYKLFQVTLEIVLQEFADTIEIPSRTQLNKKIRETSQFLGLFVLIVYSLRTTFKSILGESLIFQLIEPFFGWLTLVLLFYISQKWKEEIKIYLESTKLNYFTMLARFEDTIFSYLVSFPLLILIAIHFFTSRLLDWSSKFELVKLIYAKILRIKFETTRSASNDLNLVNEEYKKIFLSNSKSYFDDSVFNSTVFKSIDTQIKTWSEGENTEQTVAIFGPRGTGITTFLEKYKMRLENEGLECLTLNVPAKTFTEKSLDALLEPLAKIPKDKKVIVLMDNAHNFFLSTIGGFDTYKLFLERTEETRNVFFVVGFNDYSWMFLNSVLGENQYFRLECHLSKWPIEQIKRLILNLHNQTGFSLEYDSIFRSSQKVQEGVTSSENRYFYLLWERSGGNPGSAIFYWFRSLRQISANRLRVSLPVDNKINELFDLHQEMHFVYASLFRHQNLTISEATRATNLPRSVVKQAIYRGLEEGFVVNNDGRYQVAMVWIDDLRKFLKGKNLIYESQ